MENKKTLKGRYKLSNNIINYIKKIDKNIDSDSICIKKIKDKKVLINLKKDKEYFGVLKRLGSKEETSNESYFGEVYKLYFPMDIDKKKINRENQVACKIIPLSDIDYKNKNNILYDPWRELFILQEITDKILSKSLLPHFSLFYYNFICKDGNVSDYSNINIINKMKIRNILKKLKNKHDDMIEIIETYNTKNRTNQNIINNINIKLNILNGELNKYSYDIIKNPNPKYSLLVLIELEDSTLSKIIYPSLKNEYSKILKIDEINISKKQKNDFYTKEILKNTNMDIIKKNPKMFHWIYTNRLFMYSILFQISMGINGLNNLGIVHLDLHIDNILISLNDKPLILKDNKALDYWNYEINGQEYLIPNYGYQCRLSDFGLSETIESFKKRKKEDKKEIAMFIIDKLSYFVFTSQEQRKISNVSNNIIHNIINHDTTNVFKYFKLFDFIILLISLISELEYISKELYFIYQKESMKRKREKNKKRLNIGEVLEKFNLIPDYIDTLKIVLANSLDIFLNNLGQNPKKDKLKGYDFIEIISEIINPFKKINIIWDSKNRIINKKPYIISK